MNEFETIQSNWTKILDTIREEHDILPVSFKTWLEPLKLYSLINGELVIIVPQEGYIKYLDKKYSVSLKVAIEECTGIPIEIHFLIEQDAQEYVHKLE